MDLRVQLADFFRQAWLPQWVKCLALLMENKGLFQRQKKFPVKVAIRKKNFIEKWICPED